MSQFANVDNIADNDGELQKEAKELSGENLTIGETDIEAEAGVLDASIGAVLVKRAGEPGAFRVTGPGITGAINIVTGPGQSGFVIVIIKEGQTAMCLGHPTMRLFSRQTDGNQTRKIGWIAAARRGSPAEMAGISYKRAEPSEKDRSNV